MGRIEKLLVIAGLGWSVYGRWLPRGGAFVRYAIKDVTSLVVLAVIGAIIAGVMLACAFGILYLALLSAGLPPMGALAIILGGLFVALCIVLLLIRHRLHRMKALPRRVMQHNSAGDAAMAFLDGLCGKTLRH